MIALDWSNRIYSNIKDALYPVCKTVMRQETDFPASFPAVWIYQTGGDAYKTDLDINDNGAMVSFQIQTFAKGNDRMQKSKEMMGLIDAEFRRMGFRCVRFKQLTNSMNTIADMDTDVFRYAADYIRPIMSGDVITKRPVGETGETG